MSNSCTLAVKVIPHAPRTELAGWLGDALKIKLHAPPVDGRANAELRAFLAARLGLPLHAVTLLRGAASPRKLVRLDGLAPADLRAALDA